MKKNTLIIAITYLLVVLFLYAALSKMLDYKEFNKQLKYSPFISQYSNILSWALPGIEIAVCLLLLISSTRLLGLYASFTLMSMFTVYLVCMLSFSSREDVPCPCGGILGELSWNSHALFNILFVVISLAGIILQRKLKVGKEVRY